MPPDRKPLRRVSLRGHHRSHGRVHMFVEGEEIKTPAMLEIVKPAPGDACHIVYIDSAHLDLTETWHPTVEAALYHAKWEFGIKPEEWEILSDG